MSKYLCTKIQTSETQLEVYNFIANAKRYDNVDRVGYLIKDIRSGSIF